MPGLLRRRNHVSGWRTKGCPKRNACLPGALLPVFSLASRLGVLFCTQREGISRLDPARPICKARNRQFCPKNGEKCHGHFDKREEGFEKKFAHDEELRFKGNARRNKLLGNWAADQLGLSGAEADAYAKEVVMSAFDESGEDGVFRKIRKDFDAKGVHQSDHQIRRTMDDLMAQAVAQIKVSG